MSTRQKSTLGDSIAKEVLTPKSGEPFIFPIEDGTVKLSGRECGVRKSTLKRDQPARSEDLREELQENSERSQPSVTKGDAEAQNDFWTMEEDFICPHIVEPQVQLYVPKEESFPTPLK